VPSKSVLITGVCGVLGGAIHRQLARHPARFDLWGLDSLSAPRQDLLPDWTPNIPAGRLTVGDVADFDLVTRALEGMDVVIHMAAVTDPAAPWEQLLRTNIAGTHNVFEASRQAGVHRVILASSVRVSFGYYLVEPYRSIFDERFADVPDPIPLVTHRMPTWPVGDYSAGKIWAEALAHSYAVQFYLPSFCLRVGGVAPDGQPWTERGMDTSIWCSLRDLCQLVERCLDAPVAAGQFDVFYAVSDNRYRWVDIDHARQVVGYVPQDGLQDDPPG